VLWLLLVLSATPSWDSLLDIAPAKVAPTPPPGSFERRAALDAVEAGIDRWRRERAGFAREKAENERIRRARAEEAEVDPSAPPVPVERGAAKRASGKPGPKLIEVVPDAVADPTDGWLDEQVAKKKKPDAVEQDVQKQFEHARDEEQRDAEKK
jgi:hypothetical protein